MEDKKITRKIKLIRADKKECTAFCPICGTDLLYQINTCLCKNKSCSWLCEACREDDDI